MHGYVGGIMDNKKYDLISKRSLEDKNMIVPHLASNGLASPMRTFYDLFPVWILAWNILPQPDNYVGVWVDSDVWDDTSYWYD